MYAQDRILVQGGLFYLNQDWQLYSGVLASEFGDVGYSVRSNWRLGRWSMNLDYRQLFAARPSIDFSERTILDRDLVQGSASLTVPVGKGRMTLQGRRRLGIGGSQNELGLSYQGSVLDRLGLDADLTVDLTLGSEQRIFQAGLVFRLRRRDSHVLVRTGARLRRADGDADFTPTLDTRLNRTGLLPSLAVRAGQLEQSYSITHDDQRSALGALFRPRQYPFSDIELGFERNQLDSGLFYAVNNQFSLAHTDGKFALGQSGGAAAVIVDIDSQVNEVFEVLVDDQVVGRVTAGRPGIISLRPYESYSVTVRPFSDRIIGYDESAHQVTLYPGTVERLTFAARELIVMIGQLQDPAGTQLGHARFNNVEGFGRADDSGWFQIEVGHHDPLLVQPLSGSPCRVLLPEYIVQEGLVVFDQPLVCQPIPAPR